MGDIKKGKKREGRYSLERGVESGVNCHLVFLCSCSHFHVFGFSAQAAAQADVCFCRLSQ